MTIQPAKEDAFATEIWKEELTKAGGVVTPDTPRKKEAELPKLMTTLRLSTEDKTEIIAQTIVSKKEKGVTKTLTVGDLSSADIEMKFSPPKTPPQIVRVRSARTFYERPGDSPPTAVGRIGDSPMSTWRQASLKSMKGGEVLQFTRTAIPEEFLTELDPTKKILSEWKEFTKQLIKTIPDMKLEKREVVSKPPSSYMFNNYGLYPDVAPVVNADTITCMLGRTSYVLPSKQAFFSEGQIFPTIAASRYCDATHVFSQKNYQLFAIADGCGLFKGAQTAAAKACEIVCKEIKHLIDSSKKLSLKDIAAFQLLALKKTIDVLQTFEEIGDTTLLVAAVIDGYLIALSVGDCTLLRIRRRVDSDAAECLSLFEPRESGPKDPGGFLGITPKLNNLAIAVQRIEKDDLLFACTDGVSDNFDPLLTGGKFAYSSSAKASSLGDMRLKQGIAHNKLLSMIGKETDLDKIATQVQQYIYKLTFPAKLWQLTQTTPVPKDYKKYPGKEDHATMVLFRYEETTESRGSRFSKKGK